LPTPIDHHKGRRKKDPKEKPHKQKYVGCLHLFGISISPENPYYSGWPTKLLIWWPTENHAGIQTIKRDPCVLIEKEYNEM
jgi:hypothetical protein